LVALQRRHRSDDLIDGRRALRALAKLADQGVDDVGRQLFTHLLTFQ